MMPNPKCKSCRISLRPNVFQNKTWYGCTQCAASFVPVSTFTTILPEPEYNRFVSEIRKAQIKSSENCPSCSRQMIKIVDLAYKNEVEVCSHCQLVWLDPNEGNKIKNDLTYYSEHKGMINMPSSQIIMPEIQTRLQDGQYDPLFGGYGFRTEKFEQDVKISLGNRLINKFLDFSGFYDKKNTTRALIIGLVILIILVFIVKNDPDLQLNMAERLIRGY